MNMIEVLSDEGKKMDFIRWNKCINEEIEGASDRSLVIVSCSVLDVQLEKILMCYMVNKSEKRKKELFKNSGILGTFSAKIDMSYFCGLISEHERKTIDTMRKIRNKFAHEIEISSLEDGKVKDLCNNLFIPDRMYVPDIIEGKKGKFIEFDIEPFKDGKMKTRYIKTFKYISRYLEKRCIYIKQQEEFQALDEIESLENEIKTVKESMMKIQEMKKQSEELNKQILELKKTKNNMCQMNVKEDIKEDNKEIGNGNINSEKSLEDMLVISRSEYMEYLENILDVIKRSYGID